MAKAKLPLWEEVYNLEKELTEQILQKQKNYSYPTTIYCPIYYAAEIHRAFLEKYLTGPKKVLFIGMNPGFYGMGQTGVPFGNISTVKDEMNLRGNIVNPPTDIKSRPIKGLNETIEEPSGKRLWSYLKELSNGSLDTFFMQCFVYNFGPTIFFDSDENIITQEGLRDDFKEEVTSLCLNTTKEIVRLLKPEIIVAIGRYVETSLKRSTHLMKQRIRIVYITHPSPVTDLSEVDWRQKVKNVFDTNNIVPYICNEI